MQRLRRSREQDTLVLLTAAYPFGRTWETFLEAELPILAERFSRVIVLPSSTDAHVRPLPAGVECETVLADARRPDVARELLRSPLPAASRYLSAVIRSGVPSAYLRHPVSYLGRATLGSWKYRALGRFVRSRSLEDALFYDYWLGNSTIALGLLRRRGVIRRAIARAHGFDLYDEAHEYGAVPYRSFAVESLDRVFPISADGLAYLGSKHPGARTKLILSRLGVPAQTVRHDGSSVGTPLLLSCSGMLPGKRIHLIPEVLARIGRPLRWIHFGDGPEHERVTLAAASLPETVEWRLAGHVDHETVIDFYRRNRVDLLLSASASEGIPVSMMEAISFGVPVLATSVGGVPELVTPDTGDLADLDESPQALADRARRLLDGGAPSRDRVIAFFDAHFDARKNFNEFVDRLLEV